LAGLRSAIAELAPQHLRSRGNAADPTINPELA
jgi:hypothetical protein